MKDTEHRSIKSAYDAICKAIALFDSVYAKDGCGEERLNDAYEELVFARLSLNELI